jgi:hypothetical protein
MIRNEKRLLDQLDKNLRKAVDPSPIDPTLEQYLLVRSIEIERVVGWLLPYHEKEPSEDQIKREMKSARAAVNRWLSGETKPTGDNWETLRGRLGLSHCELNNLIYATEYAKGSPQPKQTMRLAKGTIDYLVENRERLSLDERKELVRSIRHLVPKTLIIMPESQSEKQLS